MATSMSAQLPMFDQMTLPDTLADGPSQGIRQMRGESASELERLEKQLESGFPLVKASPARILRLRGYGDGIVAPQAAAFVRAFMQLT